MGVDTSNPDPSGSSGSGSSGSTSTGSSGSGASFLDSGQYGTIYFPVVGGSLPSGSHIGLPRSGGRTHEGIDLMAPRGSTVVATVSGTVVSAGNVGGLGGVIVKIRDQFGNMHYYAHLDPSSVGVVRTGMQVQAGQTIGFVGNTGNAASTDPHLHYSINEASGGSGPLYDPYDFLRSGDLVYGGGSGATGMTGNAAPQPGAETPNIPDGGTWFNDGGAWYVAFRFTGIEGGPSRVNYFRSATSPPDGARRGSTTFFRDHKANWTDGGTTDAFRGVPDGKTYQQLVDDMLMQLGLAGTDALRDPGVMAIVSLAMTRELSPEELSNRLRQTNWFQSRTDSQREWDDLSQAEKDQRIVDEAMKLAGLWFTYVGADMEMAGADLNNDGVTTTNELRKYNPELYQWASGIANGTLTQSQAINQWMKEEAAENPNSPWSRTLREEEQAQGQFGVDVSNMAGQIRDLHFAWGMPVSDRRVNGLAEKIVMNEMSIEDLETILRDQAQALYPDKPAALTTREWAEPYMQSYMNLLETPEVSLRDPLLQRGLKEGMTLADFDKMLRHDDRWLETDNARANMNEQFSGLGRVMGF